MQVVFVHGWSVQNTNTYGALPLWLQRQGAKYEVENVYLGKYISFDDAVNLDDLARAFDNAISEALGVSLKSGFACITHSTGGPVVRKWVDLYYRRRLKQCPMTHLVMLAPANHGSALAQLGKSRLGRLKATLLDGVEPGVRILDWLELGSDESWSLNEAWLDYNCVAGGIYTFVLAGQSIDRSLYDYLNSYTGEPGSDGVVRVSAANMNYTFLKLFQVKENLRVNLAQRSRTTAFGILPGLSHSGERMGIIRSVTSENANVHPTVQWVAKCLEVDSASAYTKIIRSLAELTLKTQKDQRVERIKKLVGSVTYKTSRYSMLIFRLVDDRGATLEDYDLYITAGPKYSPDEIPKGFFVDRQRNRRNPGKLTYFVDFDILSTGLSQASLDGKLGFRILARPIESSSSLAFYKTLEFRSNVVSLSKILRPNETLMIEVKMERCIDATVFRIDANLTPSDITSTRSGEIAP